MRVTLSGRLWRIIAHADVARQRCTAMPNGYYRRLFSRAWRETKAVFTWARWWLLFAPPLTGILLRLGRKGWRDIMNAQDILYSACAGALTAFIGTFLINLLRSPRLLHDDAQTLSENRDRSLTEAAEDATRARAELKAFQRQPRVSALEQEKRDRVATKLKTVGPEDLAVLKHILVYGRMSIHELRGNGEVLPHFEHWSVIDGSLGRCATAGLINFEMVSKPFAVTEYWVKPELTDALSFWLIERHGDLTPPS